MNDACTNYNPHLEKAIQEIEISLHEDLPIDYLAHISGYSFSHFQKLFKIYTGESVASYIRRTRIEMSAFMLKYQYNTILDAGMNLGFNSNTSFTRAFKSYYKISPLEFKERFKTIKKREELPSFKVIEIKDFQVFYLREYGDFSTTIPTALKKADLFFKEMTNENTKYISTCYGEPTISKNFKKLRYDACILYDKNKHLNIKNIPLQTVKGGKYVKFKFEGNIKELGAFYYQIFNSFFHHNEYQVASRPFIQMHNTSFSEILQNQLSTEILIPID